MGLFRASCACDPLTLLIRVASNTRPCSKFDFEWRGGRKEVSVLSHRCVTSSEVKTAGFQRSVLTFLNISGCSERKNRMLKSHHIKESFFHFRCITRS